MAAGKVGVVSAGLRSLRELPRTLTSSVLGVFSGGRRLLRALRQNLAAWTVLFFSQGIKGLVNQVEQPFARSLIACETPVDPDAYTGSRWCGDRLQVIQEGMYLSAIGQGQESFAMLCSLTFVIILTGVAGPRVSLTLGLLGVTVSIVLFVVASTSPELGRSLFALGQGLQGLYPIEYLIGILMLHMGMLPNADGEANFQIMSYMFILSNVFWNILLGNGVSLLELSDYGRVWTIILAIAVSILLLTLFGFPSMKPMGSDKFEGRSPFMKVVLEVLSYKDLALDWRARRYLVKMFFENIASTFHYTVVPPSLMAYHGWSQLNFTIVMISLQIAELFTIPYYKTLLVKRFGFKRSYVGTVRYFVFVHMISGVVLLWSDYPYVFNIVTKMLLAGFFPLKGFVDSRFSEPEQMQRFQSVQWVMGYFLGIWSGPMYAAHFNAWSPSAWERSTPFLLFGLVSLGIWWSVFCLIYDMDGVHGFAVTVRVLDDLQTKGTELWRLVATSSGTEAFPAITEEKWRIYNLEAFLGVSHMHVGVPILTFDHWEFVVGGMNATPSQGHVLVKRLDAAIAHAKQVQHGYAEAVQAGLQGEYAELEGQWLPTHHQLWLRQHEAWHPKTVEVWSRHGEGHFQNGDWEVGTLKVLGKQNSQYFLSFKLLTGPSAGLEGNLVMHLGEDGVRRYEVPPRFLKKNEAHQHPPREAGPPAASGDAAAAGEPAKRDGGAPGGGGPAVPDGEPGTGEAAPVAGAEAPAPEGKKDA